MKFPSVVTLIKILFIFFAGVVFGAYYEWLQPITTVEFVNASSQNLDHISINIKNGGVPGEFHGDIAHELAPGSKFTFKWHNPSEMGYLITAKFVDGSQVSGGMGYSERGMLIQEVITAEKVMTTSPEFPFGQRTHDTTFRPK